MIASQSVCFLTPPSSLEGKSLMWPWTNSCSGLKKKMKSVQRRFRTVRHPFTWFLFNWEYDSASSEVELPGPEGITVAELYAEDPRKRLDPLEHKLIEGINRKPYTFFQVEHVDHGKGMQLKDVLKGDSIEVQERSGSEYVQPGDLVFGRPVRC